MSLGCCSYYYRPKGRFRNDDGLIAPLEAICGQGAPVTMQT